MQNIILIIFIIIRICSNPLAGVIQKKLSVRRGAIVINFYSYLFLSLLCLSKINLIKSFNYTNEFISLVLICGILCTTGMICMIKAVKIGELSVLGPINSYKSVIGLIIAFIFLKEIPSVQGIIGMILIIYGSKFILYSKEEKPSFNVFKRKDIQLRFTAMTLTAIEAVLLKKIILISSVEICFIFWCFMGLFWSLILMFISDKKFIIPNRKDMALMFITGLLLGLMQYSTNFVFERMNVGYALALFQLSAIVTVLLGAKFFMEKNIMYKLTGSFIMIVGSYLILC